MNASIREISITFPEPVELTREEEQMLREIASRACKRYEKANPGRVMWPAGFGSRPLNVWTCGDDEPLEFQEDALCIDCSEREDYKWLCAKCGISQGDHKHCITMAPAGTCDFVPAEKPRPSQGIDG